MPENMRRIAGSGNHLANVPAIVLYQLKTYKHLWEPFSTWENFDLACYNSQKNKGKQNQVIEFNKDRDGNLHRVYELVLDGLFHTSSYSQSTIYEPKERIIYKLPYAPDRIVQHAVMNVLKPIFVNLMIKNTYACIEGRGQHLASVKCSEYVRKYDYCLKCDIRKFYPSINQKRLSKKLHRIIKDPLFMEIVDDIVFSFPGGYNCPIGNYCSQWFGNFYLTFLDNFVLHELKYGAYERYCDDFMLFSNDKSFLHYARKRMEEFLYDELELRYSKSDVFHTKQGVDFCGYRHFKNFILVRKKTALRMKKRLIYIQDHMYDPEFDLERARSQIASANGLLKHACTQRLRESMRYNEIKESINELIELKKGA